MSSGWEFDRGLFLMVWCSVILSAAFGDCGPKNARDSNPLHSIQTRGAWGMRYESTPGESVSSDMTDMRHEIIMQQRRLSMRLFPGWNADFPICTSRPSLSAHLKARSTDFSSATGSEKKLHTTQQQRLAGCAIAAASSPEKAT